MKLSYHELCIVQNALDLYESRKHLIAGIETDVAKLSDKVQTELLAMEAAGELVGDRP